MPRTQLPKDIENALTPFHQDSPGPLVLLLGIIGRLLGNVSHIFKNKSTPRLQAISSYILSLAELLCYEKNNTHVTPFMLMEAWQFCFLTFIDIEGICPRLLSARTHVWRSRPYPTGVKLCLRKNQERESVLFWGPAAVTDFPEKVL